MKTLYDKIAPFLLTEPTIYLEDGTYRQTCLAIARALGQGQITADERSWLGCQIRKRVYPFADDLEDWLQSRNLLSTLAHLSPDDRYRQIQAYRHRWLKHLCEEYENARSLR